MFGGWVESPILLAKTGRSSAAEIPAALHQVIDSHLMEGAGA
jgi:hypothetical protein